jgi:hypothetical protein
MRHKSRHLFDGGQFMNTVIGVKISGTVFRVPTDLIHPDDRTIDDVLDEEFDKGNDLYHFDCPTEFRKKPAKYSYWVCFNEEDAEIYADTLTSIEDYVVIDTHLIASDNKGGYLIYTEQVLQTKLLVEHILGKIQSLRQLLYTLDDMNDMLELEDEEIIASNTDKDEYDSHDEILADIEPEYDSNVIIQHRDWTVGTIVDQIRRENIDLNPKFQRRNVWNNGKRTGLIDSLMLGVPIPEIIMAEDKTTRRFFVIDGKQRLSTLAAFFKLDDFEAVWARPKLGGNLSRQMLYLKGKGFDKFSLEDQRLLENASIRCAFISGYKNIDVLYDIFYRLNSNSVALSAQELRQTLNRGQFADYLVEATNEYNNLHKVMKLKGADNRLRDAELLLRFITLFLFPQQYDGNLKKFLDARMGEINKSWPDYQSKVQRITQDFMQTIDVIKEVVNGYENVGRKFDGKEFEARFNKVLFEVQVYYFMFLKDYTVTQRDQYLRGLAYLSQDTNFESSIGDTTKGIAEYRTRYTAFGEMFNEVFDTRVSNPFPMR